MRVSASVATLKARLSEYLRQVKAGSEVLITERGVAIARLTGLDPTERRATRRTRLARAGTLRPGRGKPRATLLTPPTGDRVGDDVLAALIAERHEAS